MVEQYDGEMKKKVKIFFKYTLGEEYTLCKTYIVPQDEIDLISPPKKYPNPEFDYTGDFISDHINEIRGHLSKIIELIEASKTCRYNGNPKECPFFETKRLKDLADQMLNPNKISKNVVNNINRINKKLKYISKKFNAERVHCFNYNDGFCCHNCTNLIEKFRIRNIEQKQYRFEFNLDGLNEYSNQITIGLYLNREHKTNRGNVYPKKSVLISKDILCDSGKFEQTFVHEHTHAMLHACLGDIISKNKGLNEGFAVAMEFFYAKKYGLSFNEKRYGEYLAHQILTILDNPKYPRKLFEKLKGEYGV